MPENRQVIEKGRPHVDALWNGDFDAPLKTHLNPVRGYGVPNFIRATAAWNFNDSGKLVEVPSGAARFTGARMVYNRIPKSENLSDASWVKRGAVTATGSQIDPNGGTTAYQLDNLGLAGVNDVYCNATNAGLAQGRPMYVGFWLKRISTTGTLRVSNSTSFNWGRFLIDLSGLPDGWVYIDKNSPYAVITNEFIVSDVNNVGLLMSESASNNISVQVWGITSTLLEEVNQSNAQNEYVSSGVLSGSFHGAGIDGVKFFSTDNGGGKISSENLRGILVEGARTNSLRQCRDLTQPATGSGSGVKCWSSESYGTELLTNVDFSGGLTGWTNISSGTGTATLSGGGVALSGTDGSNRGAIEQLVTGLDTSAMYMFQMNVSSFTSGNITMAVGQATGTASLENYYVFASSAGVWSRMVKPPTSSLYIKIMTSGSGGVGTIDDISFKPATINAVENETGIDGVTNSCTTLTAITDDATIYQGFTAAAAARTFSVYVKRKTGTGTISLTRNGGTTWADVTSQIVNGKFTRVYVRNNSVTDPICGIKLGTAGDEIVVDCAQDEAGAIESSPIITTTATVTRNGETCNYSSLNLNSQENTCYHEAWPSDSAGASYDRRSLFLTAFNNNRAGYYYQYKYAGYGDGSGVIPTGSGAYPLGDQARVILRWQNGSPGSAFSNGIKHSDTVGNVNVTPSTVDIGCTQSTSSVFVGNIKNVKIFKRLLTDEQCINGTLLGVD